ncbi:TonB-dependent receptor domain-containing protein [Nitrospirillum iridis]|uniref:Outer membrane receptor protein involved in Fe transport n=1 Tax=Nitrospirillum iridis TaxID=765888 RepID=A0A7X0B011_9PROT|nr:TonB-dependent receptor [Nitrospirillum iridis]MBB6252175.1 outer membrane receptor protein involved in Fe transport [Nitrospirillum iridis]
MKGFESRIRQSLLTGAAIGVCALTSMATTAYAAADDLQEIVITGSRIKTDSSVGISPVTTVSNEEIKLQGATRMEDVLNNLPQVFASQGGNISNGSTGTATVNLRGLGSQRTLVLIDGHRMPAGSPLNSAADLNEIPTALVKRVEVLSGGASAVYGADAVAGVVNFIMDDKFEGAKAEVGYSFYQHNNDSTRIQNAVKARNFALPDDDVTDGFTRTYSGVLGVNSTDGKGNITVYAEYLKAQPLQQGARDYSACAISVSSKGAYSCGGSGTTAPAQIIDNIGGGDYIVSGKNLNNYTSASAFNYAPYNYYQRPDQRYSAGFFGHYDFNEHVQVYTEFMFHDDHTLAQIAPSGVFGQEFTIGCDSPLLSASQINTLCTANGLTSSDKADVSILRRNVEGGGRIDDLRHTSYRELIGLKGDLYDGWSYDVSAQRSTVILSETYKNDFSLARTAEALNVTKDSNGNLVCANSAAVAAGCSPYTIFDSSSSISSAALTYLQTPGFKEGSTVQDVVNASISGDLGRYGLQSPLANRGVAIVFGTEYRREELTLKVDQEFDSGDLAGQGGPTHGVAGAYDVREAFMEVKIPVIQDKPFIKEFNIEGGYRYSDYSTSGKTDTYKVGGDWAPTSDLRLRAGFNHAVRAPNVVELFTPQGVALGLTDDPCAGSSPSYTLAQCARTGVTAAQYGKIVANGAGQYNDLEGGNPNLKPEAADTLTVGTVITPTFLPDLTFSADYYNIHIDDTINGIGADLIMTNCLNGINTSTFCPLIKRSATGSLWLGTTGYVTNTNQNTGSLEQSGIDFNANYRVDLADIGLEKVGALNFNMTGTYLIDFVTQALKGSDGYDCAGYFGANCGVPAPVWRHKVRATWQTPWDADISVAWRHLSSVAWERNSSNATLHGTSIPGLSEISSYDYFDFSGSYQVSDWLTLSGGVNNVFDKDPPLATTQVASSSYINGNTYAQVYDSLGRYFFFRASAKF